MPDSRRSAGVFVKSLLANRICFCYTVTVRRISLVAKPLLPKQTMGVRFPYPAPTKNTLLADKSVFFVYPSRMLGISSRVSVYIIKGGSPPLYLITSQACIILSCGLMRYSPSC